MERVLSTLLVLALALSQVSAQSNPQLGRCENSYQTSINFTQAFIEKMAEPDSSYLLLMSDTSGDRCQKLHLSSTAYVYSYISSSTNISANASNTYTAVPWSLTNSASLTFNTGSTLLPGFLSSNEALYPLIANDDYIVFFSCRQQNLIQRRYIASVWVREPYNGAPSVADIQKALTRTSVKQLQTLLPANTNCTSEPKPPAAATPPNAGSTILQLLTGALNPQSGGGSNIINTLIQPAPLFGQPSDPSVPQPSTLGASVPAPEVAPQLFGDAVDPEVNSVRRHDVVAADVEDVNEIEGATSTGNEDNPDKLRKDPPASNNDPKQPPATLGTEEKVPTDSKDATVLSVAKDTLTDADILASQVSKAKKTKSKDKA